MSICMYVCMLTAVCPWNRYMSFNIMGISRDVLLHAYGADCTQENDEIIIVGKSMESYSGQGDIPWKPVGWFHQRLIIKEFKLVLHIESPTTAKVPNLYISNVYMYVYTYCMCTAPTAYNHTCIHTYISIPTYIHTYIRMLFKHHIYVIHTYAYTFIHTYIHTNHIYVIHIFIHT